MLGISSFLISTNPASSCFGLCLIPALIVIDTLFSMPFFYFIDFLEKWRTLNQVKYFLKWMAWLFWLFPYGHRIFDSLFVYVCNEACFSLWLSFCICVWSNMLQYVQVSVCLDPNIWDLFSWINSIQSYSSHAGYRVIKSRGNSAKVD